MLIELNLWLQRAQSAVNLWFFYFFFKRQHMFLYRPVSKEWRLYLACSSTAQPATGLIRTLMPYTHRMSSKLRLFLEQYAQGVSGRAPVATYAPHPVLENITVDPWAQVTSNLSFIILQSKKTLIFIANVQLRLSCIKTKLEVNSYLYLMQLANTTFCLHNAVAIAMHRVVNIVFYKLINYQWNSERLKEIGLYVGAETTINVPPKKNKLPVRHSVFYFLSVATWSKVS